MSVKRLRKKLAGGGAASLRMKGGTYVLFLDPLPSFLMSVLQGTFLRTDDGERDVNQRHYVPLTSGGGHGTRPTTSGTKECRCKLAKASAVAEDIPFLWPIS